MRQRLIRVAIPSLFFVSGAAGLVYQVVWSRLLNELFGITAYAITAVLAAYLGGLALGSWILGRVADRWSEPLRFYALLEIGVGLTALAGTFALGPLDTVHVALASRLAPGSGALVAARCLLAAVVVLPPTFLMGGTLPAMTRAVVTDLASFGGKLGAVYAINTAGAVVGTGLSGFVLIRELGVRGTLWAAVATNVLIGAVAWWCGRPGGARAPADLAEAATGEPPPAAGRAEDGGASLLLAVALSGAASLGLEVLWTRMLVLVVGTSTYAFVTMLAAFLVGIALGSAATRLFVDRVTRLRRAFGWIQVAIAASTLATIPLARLLMSPALGWLGAAGTTGHRAALARFGLSFGMMVVPTTLIGTTFPVAARIRATARDVSGRVGRLYAANTAGNIAGAVVGGLVVLPVFGLQKGVAVLAVLNLAAAAWALLPAAADHRRGAFLLRAAPVSAGLWGCALLTALWNPTPLPGSGGGPFDTTVFYKEGLVSTVKVTRRADDGRQVLMAVDGITIGQSSAGVDKKQQVLAHLPFLVGPGRSIERVLSIGLGTGILVGEVARHPGVRSVECIELSPSVIEAAREFGAFNGEVLANPAVKVVNDDGINYLKRSTSAYDAIISDGKSKSGHAGNAAFYSQEYYRSARAHLTAGGVMLQWVPIDVAPDDLRIIVRTFDSAFPFTYVWVGEDSSFLLGTDRPLVLDVAHLEKELAAPATEHLRRHGWRTPADVVGLLVADQITLRDWLAGDSTVNTLDRPVLEFFPPGTLASDGRAFSAANLASFASIARRGSPPTARIVGEGVDPSRSSGAVALLLEGVSQATLRVAQPLSLLRRAIASAPEMSIVRQWGADALVELARRLDLGGDLDHAIDLYREALRAAPGVVEARVNLGRALALRGWRNEAVREYQLALAENPLSGTAHRALGDLLASAGDLDGAIRHDQEALRLAPGVAELHDVLGLALAGKGRYDEALSEFREAMRLQPDWPPAMDQTALMLATRPGHREADVAEAIALARRAAELTPDGDPMTLETLAAAYAAGGRFRDAVEVERRALALVQTRGDSRLAAQVSETLARFEHGQGLSLDAPAPAPESVR